MYQQPRPTPIVTGREWALVIADTSGFHFRGYAQPGAQRVQSKMQWKWPTVDCLPRKHLFYCETLPDDC